VQGSLFAAYDYLGFKRKKLGLFHRFNLKRIKQQTIFACSKAQRRLAGAHEVHGLCAGCTWGSPCARILAFSSRFQLIFRLKTLGTWNEFSLLCIVFKNLLRTIGLQSSYLYSFMWYLNLLIYTISHYKTLKTYM
jgi:hypothetical protein